MTTIERAQALASAAGHFPFLGATLPKDLLDLVEVELGDAEALDHFVPRGKHRARAIAPTHLLHVIAGNTPAAGLQSLVRGVLLGSRNLVKLPSEGLPEIGAFCGFLPAALVALVETSTVLPPEWLERADAVIVFGNDATIDEFQRRVRADQKFVAHGHRISFGAIFDDPEFASVDAAARDASAFDQLGCLSPHVYYVADAPREYAARLAESMARHEVSHPREKVPTPIANRIRALREETKFRVASGEACAVFESDGSTAWTVIYDEAPGFPNSPLHRSIFVKPMPTELADELAPIRRHLSCAGIFPVTSEHAARLGACGVSRICPLGQMQLPPWTWHQDGQSSLASLVRWVDMECD